MGIKKALKRVLILFYVVVAFIGALYISINVYVMGLNVRPIIYTYALIVVSILSAIQLSWLLESIVDRTSPEFLLTTFFRMEDEPKRDVVRDPVAFLGLLLLILGGFIIWPIDFFIGLMKIIEFRPPTLRRLPYVEKLLLSYAVVFSIFLAIGFALIEKRYA